MNVKVTPPEGSAPPCSACLLADLDVLLEDDGEAERSLVPGDRGVKLTDRHAHRRVVDDAQQPVLAAGPGSGTISIARAGSSCRAVPLDQAVHDVAEARTAAVTTEVVPSVQVRAGSGRWRRRRRPHRTRRRHRRCGTR